MRIALISDHASPIHTIGGTDSGGQNVYVAWVAKHLSRRGHQVDVYTRWEDESLPKVVEWKPGIRIVHIDAGPKVYIRKEDQLPLMEEFGKRVRTFINNERLTYDVVHANFFMSGIVALNLKRQLNIPFVITFHALGKVRQLFQGVEDEFPKERVMIEALLCEEADKIIAECPQDKEDLIRWYKAAVEKISIIPGGVDVNEFHPIPKNEAQKTLGLDPHFRYVLQLGRMVKRKGVDTVIQAFAELVTKRNDDSLRLLVVGGNSSDPDPQYTPEIGRLSNLAKELCITDKVLFVGQKNRELLKYYYNAADLFVSTPWYEPFGMTVLESMACGTPVIGSAVGGLTYTISDGITGLLVSPNNAHQLCTVMEDLLGQPQRMQRMGTASILKIKDMFTWEKIVDQLEAVYESVTIKSTHSIPEINETDDRLYTEIVQVTNTLLLDLMTSKSQVLEIARLLLATLKTEGKLIICGNGGSAAQAQHISAELVGRFKLSRRPPLSAISLTTDTSTLTAVANDFGFGEVFSRQLEAIGQPADMLMVISTSGNSENIINVLRQAKKMGIVSVALLGGRGGKARTLANLSVVIPSEDVARVQEIQLVLLHIVIEIFENLFLRDISNHTSRPRKSVEKGEYVTK